MDNTELIELIRGSRAIDEKQKKLYETIIQFLDEESKEKLAAIFIREKEGIAKIESDRDEKKSEINKNFLDKLGSFFEKTEKEAIAAEEAEEEEKSEEVLEALDKL